MRCARCHRRLKEGAACPRCGDAAQATASEPRIDDAANAGDEHRDGVGRTDAPGAPYTLDAPGTPRKLDTPDATVGALAELGYAELELRGEGGFGRVYRARADDGAHVAIKVAHVSTADARGRVEREAAALRDIARVSGRAAPALRAHGALGSGAPYIVMEWIEGEPLDAFLARSPGTGALSASDLDEVFVAIADALAHVHRAGWVHRDVKPENVILAGGGGSRRHAVWVDFGIAKRLPSADAEAAHEAPNNARDVAQTRLGARIGTSTYMAPELCRGDAPPDVRIDVYALAVVLFELATGRPPFVGAPSTVEQAHVAMRPPAVSEMEPAAAGLDAVVARGLAKAPDQRFADVEAFLAAFAARAQTGMSAPKGATAAAHPANAAARTSVALLAVTAKGDSQALLRLLGDSGGDVQAVVGAKLLVAFVAAEGATSAVRKAVVSAERAEALGLCTPEKTLHVADVRVRQARGRTVTAGRAVDDFDAWSQSTYAGLVLTADARAFAEGFALQELEPGRFALRDPAREAHAAGPNARALVGREAERMALMHAIDEAFAAEEPALVSLLAAQGLGKTALLDELAHAYEGRGVRILRVSPDDGAEGSKPATRGTLPRLVRELFELDAPGSAGLEQTLARLASKVESERLPHAFAALAHTLGLLGREDLRVAAALEAPGAFRYSVAAAIGEKLRARAASSRLLVLVDDAQTVDETTLDALEIATIEPGAPLAVVAAAPSSLAQRPQWGARSVRVATVQLGELSGDAARALLRAELAAVEFIAEPVLAALLRTTGGHPAAIVELAEALHASGAIRKHGQGQGAFLANDVVEQVAASAFVERRFRDQVERLPPALAAFAQLTAALGDGTTQAELRAIAERPELSGEGFRIDAAIAVERLAALGILHVDGERVRFANARSRHALEAATPPTRRAHIHAAIAEHLETTAEDASALSRPRRARHRAEAGSHAHAAALWGEEANEALASHRYTDAVTAFTAAIALLPRGDARRAALLAGRGRARYRLQRFHEALEDLRAARALAEDDATRADLLLDEATVLDWLHDVDGSERASKDADAIVGALVAATEGIAERGGTNASPDAAAVRRLRARSDVARGRTLWRRERLGEALEALAQGVGGAADVSDYETHVIGLLLLSLALVLGGSLDEGERRFEEVIGACERAGDALHLGVALSNRVALWIQRADLARAEADLSRTLALSRELGNAQLERIAAFNLAELLHYQGREGDAFPLATRARELQQRFFDDHPIPEDALLLARLHAFAGTDHGNAEARRYLEWVDARCPEETRTPSVRVLVTAMRLLLANDVSPAWDALDRDAVSASLLDERADVLLAAVLAAKRARDAEAFAARLEHARRALEARTHWRDRLERVAGEAPR